VEERGGVNTGVWAGDSFILLLCIADLAHSFYKCSLGASSGPTHYRDYKVGREAGKLESYKCR
jgi:hypothetical protein